MILKDFWLLLSKSKTIINSELIIDFLNKIFSDFVIESFPSLFRCQLRNQIKHSVLTFLGNSYPVIIVWGSSVSELDFLVGVGLLTYGA